MKYLALFIVFYFLSNALLAQVPSTPSFFQCGTDELYTALQNSDTAYAANEQAQEAAYRDAVTTPKKGAGSGVLILPVVVHIIHDNGLENISDAQVQKGIAWLNDAFRNRNYFNPATGADTEIEFCLAKRDLMGKAFSGILRYQSPWTDMSLQLGSPHTLTPWDTKNYINIILVREVCLYGDCHVAGYATLPGGGHGQPGEGIVMEAQYFGDGPREATVAVHEMGHYLGLLHTFQGGCKNYNCLTDGDRVCDTPPDNSTGPFPCAAQYNSCPTDADDPSLNNPFRNMLLGGLGDQSDMVRNYMDYSILECYDRFTEGQKQRMRFFVEGARAALLTSKACLPPCPAPVLATFTVDKDSIVAGGTITISNYTLQASGYFWYVNGQLISTATGPILTFDHEGEYIIRLEAQSPLQACDPGIYEKKVKVFCPVLAVHDYVVQGNQLIVTSKSISADSVYWTLKNGVGKVLFQSDALVDTFDLSGLQYVQLCLLAKNAHCERQSCTYIKLIANGIEICDNSLDDDGDGFTDRFDLDCSCDTAYYQAYCPLDCEYVPNTSPDIKLKLKWTSEVLNDFWQYNPNIVTGDIDGDGDIEIITPKTIGNWTLNNIKNTTIILDGSTGNTNLDFTFTTLTDVYANSHISIADVDGDGKAELFSILFNTIFCYSPQGILLWESDPLKDQYGREINIADFNADGVPELYVGNQILNAQNGKLLVSGNAAEGCNKPSSAIQPLCALRHSIAADLLPSPGLELAAGNTVYQVTINNPNGTVGNSMVPVNATGAITDGFTSVGDINGDGQLDVVVIRDRKYLDGGGIWVWDPRTRAIIASAKAGLSGGVAFIGNVEGDCRPEIGMTFEKELRMYQYDGSTQLKLLYNLPTTDRSGLTGITMFDFNQDGKQELVYRDETALRILEGATGNTMASYPIKSSTWMEYPVVADVDRDGHAEILINGFQSNAEDDYRVYCFGSGGTPWAPARSVWNQYGYHVTNVNDDLTIPRHPQNPATPLPGYETCLQPTCPAPYNAFLAQATYRTQQGCVQFPAVDLDLKILKYECTPDSLIFYLVLRNLSQNKIGQNCINISCYPTYPWSQTPSPPLETRCWPIVKDSALNDTIRLASLIPPGVSQMYFVVNDPGNSSGPSNFPVTDIIECNYQNNIDNIPLDLGERSLYLGPDIVKCASAVTTLYADSGFISYLWSDGSTEPIYSTGAAGLHFVEAKDHCGRILRDSVLISIDPVGGFDLGPDVSVCAGESLHFDIAGTYEQVQWVPATQVSCANCPGITVTTDTSFALVAVAGSGNCFTADTVQIQVTPSFLTEKTVRTCQLAEVGSDTLFLKTAFGCDSLIVMYTTLLPSFLIEKIAQTCQLAEVGSDTLFLKTAWGCDSLVVTTTTLSPSFLIEKAAQTCQVAEVGTDTVSLKTSFSCDSVIVTATILSPSFLIENTAQTCHVAEVGSDTLLLKTVFGCDSLIVTVTTLSPSFLIENTARTCQLAEVGTDTLFLKTAFGCDSLIVTTTALSPSFLIPKNAQTCQITEVGSDTLFLKTAFGCDSLIVTTTALSPSFLIEKTAQTCQIIEVGIDTIFLKTALGCDSLIVTTTTLLPSFLIQKTAQTCQFAEVGSDTLFLKTTFGCDSLIITTTTLSPSFLIQKNTQTCQFAEVGSDTLFLKTAFGCDSLIVTTTTLLPSFLIQKTAQTCQFSEVGNDTIFLKTVFGCDSLIVTNTTLSPSFLIQKTVPSCQLAQVGTDTIFLKTAFGCDSLIITTTTLSPSFLIQKTAQTCQLTQVGTDTIFLKTAFGCDSLIVTSTTLSPSFLIQKTAQTCQLAQVGTDTIFLKTVFGCDSLIVTFTTLSPSYLTEKIARTCQPIEVGSDTLFLKTVFGCDSLIVTATTLSPSFLTEKTVQTCQPTQVGSDTLFLKTVFGCDSLIVTATTLWPLVLVDLGLPPAPLEPGSAYAIPLTLSQQGQFDYAWSPPDGLSCHTCPDPVAHPVQTTTYRLLLTDTNGCTTSDSLTLRVKKAEGIYVPNVLAPNGSLHNQRFTVYAAAGTVERVAWLQVYDRWGGLVFERRGFAPNDESVGWDGTWRGQQVQPGVYIWQAEILLTDGSTLRKSGDVTVVE